MKKGGGIIFLGFPFAAGVAAAELAGCPLPLAAALPPAIAACFAVCALRRSGCRGIILVLYLLLGAFCRCTESLYGGLPPSAPFPEALDALQAAIDRAGFPGEHSAGIITALLTGRRGGLTPETVLAFRRSGASHILALSGLHLGVIYLFIRRILAPAGNFPAARMIRSIISIALCGAYTAVTGAGPSTVRAFLFIVINEIAGSLEGRSHSPAATFSLALMIQLCLRPSLIASVGFQLSYLAMLGIILLYPRLNSWYPGRRGILKGIWSAAALSTSCQLFTAPVAWWRFRSLPRYYLITNLLALPLTEGIIVSAIVCLVLQALEICPQALVTACGKMVQLLEFCLETISSL